MFRSKSKQDICSLEGGCKGYMFALEVTEEHDTWPERENRDRKWVIMLRFFFFWNPLDHVELIHQYFWYFLLHAAGMINNVLIKHDILPFQYLTMTCLFASTAKN